jgi:hypothetical protein
MDLRFILSVIIGLLVLLLLAELAFWLLIFWLSKDEDDPKDENDNY